MNPPTIARFIREARIRGHPRTRPRPTAPSYSTASRVLAGSTQQGSSTPRYVDAGATARVHGGRLKRANPRSLPLRTLRRGKSSTKRPQGMHSTHDVRDLPNPALAK